MYREELDMVLGHYRMCSVLGTGHFGVVYAARHTVTGDHAAVKVLAPSLCSDQSARDAFLKEGASAAVFDHPNVVKLIERSALTSKRLWIAFERIYGSTLKDHLKSIPAEHECLRLLSETLKGLAHIHDQGAIHRDLKPANIMLDTTTQPARVVIIDLGLVYFASQDESVLGEQGTPSHLAPELLQKDHQPSIQSDLYSVGVILYELLTGELPFKASHGVAVALQQLTEPVPTLPESVASSKREFWQVNIDKSLAKKPAARFASALDWASFLTKWHDALETQPQSNSGADGKITMALNEALASVEVEQRESTYMTPSMRLHPMFFRHFFELCIENIGVGLTKSDSVIFEIDGAGNARTRLILAALHRHFTRLGMVRQTSVQPGSPPRFFVQNNSSDAAVMPQVTVCAHTGEVAEHNVIVLSNGEEAEDSFDQWVERLPIMDEVLHEALRLRSHGNVRDARALLAWLVIEDQVYGLDDKLKIRGHARSKNWITDFEQMRVFILKHELQNWFSESYASVFIALSLCLGSSWTESTMRSLLLRVEQTIDSEPAFWLVSDWLGHGAGDFFSWERWTDGTEAWMTVLRNEPARSAIGLTLQHLQQISIPEPDEMKMMVTCRMLLGSADACMRDVLRFMDMQHSRQAYRESLQLVDHYQRCCLKSGFQYDSLTVDLLASQARLLSGEIKLAAESFYELAQFAKKQNMVEARARATFNLGLTLRASGESERGSTFVRKAIDLACGADWENHDVKRRELNLWWVTYWLTLEDVTKFESSLLAFLSNRRPLEGERRGIVLVISYLLLHERMLLTDQQRNEIQVWLGTLGIGESVSITT